MGSSSRRVSVRGGRRQTRWVSGLFVGALGIAAVLALGFTLAGRASKAASDGSDGRTLGRPDAPVKLDVWADFQCPTCAVFSAGIERRLIATYIDTGKASLTFHDMAFMGPESLGAAIGGRCAERQQKFWPYHDLLFANQGPEKDSGAFSMDRIKAHAATLGLDLAAFSACLTDPAVERLVVTDTQRAYAIKVKETPTLFVNGKAVTRVMNWPTVAATIDAALKERASTP